MPRNNVSAIWYKMKIVDFANQIVKINAPIMVNDRYAGCSLKFYPKHNCVFVPDKTVGEFYCSEMKSKSGFRTYLIIKELLFNASIFTKEQHLNGAKLLAFYLIHEEGHWSYFNKRYLFCDQSHEDYLDDYYWEENKWVEKLYEDYVGADRKVMLAYYYRKNRFEKEADNYALNKIIEKEALLELFKEQSDMCSKRKNKLLSQQNQ